MTQSNQPDVTGFQLRRVNPFHGLMIDADIWRDAHDYHRAALRLHNLALHGWGIVHGLDLTLGDSPNSIVVQPGLAIDPVGNFVLVTQPHRHVVEAREAMVVYLLLQYSEVPAEPFQPAGVSGGQPTRVVEAYRIQQRTQLPTEPSLELGRIHFDPKGPPIALASDPASPGVNELNVRHRPVVGEAPARAVDWRVAEPTDVPRAAPEVAVAPIRAEPPPALPPPAPEPRVSVPQLTIAVAAHECVGWNSHLDGVRYLARDVGAATGRAVQVLDPVPVGEAERVDVLYVTGQARLALSDSDAKALGRLLDRGGTVVGEGCAAGPRGDAGALDFARSYAELGLRIGRQLARVERGHPLLVARHVFSSAPVVGAAGTRSTTMVLEAGGMVFTDGDFGCAWQGGARDRPLPRAAIRDATEFGVNLATYRSRT